MSTFVIPEIKISKKNRDNLGEEYAHRIHAAQHDRDTRMQKVWALSQKNYEGKTEPIDWPWKNASNAVISLTPAHTDAWAARLYNSGTTHDPIFLTSAWGKGDIAEGITIDDYAELWQQWSKWLEKEEIPVKDLMQKVTTITAKYGDCFVYLPWEHDQVMDVSFAGEDVSLIPKDRVNKPVPHVIHPKDWYQPMNEEDLQRSPWCGFNMPYYPDEVRMKGHTEEWNKKAVDDVMKFVALKTKKELKRMGPKHTGYYARTEDGREMARGDEEFQNEMKRTLEMQNAQLDTRMNFVHVFGREDVHNEGTPVELDMVIHPESKIIVSLKYNMYGHKKRPITQFVFLYREGTWMNIGVPEMLFNSQRVMNDIVRDMLNNNQIANTKLFIARAGGVIDADEPIFPSRVIFAEDVDADFKTLDMGTSRGQSDLASLNVIQAWAERRDGMTDFNLGRERSSRTPATTMLAILEEGNERVVAIVDRQKGAQAEVWTQVHQLYAQQKNAPSLDRVLGAEDAIRLRAAWDAMDPEDIRKKLVLKAEVSTQNLNRAVKRQEMATLMGQLDAHMQRQLQLAQAMRSTQDPVLKELFTKMAKAGQDLMRKILNTYDIKEQEDMNPDVAALVGQVPQGAPFIDEQTNPADPSAQVDQAAAIPGGEGQAAGPINAPNRPQAGFPRQDGGGGS